MLICCLGDSITEGDYGIFQKRGIADVHFENYLYFLQKLADFDKTKGYFTKSNSSAYFGTVEFDFVKSK